MRQTETERLESKYRKAVAVRWPRAAAALANQMVRCAVVVHSGLTARKCEPSVETVLAIAHHMPVTLWPSASAPDYAATWPTEDRLAALGWVLDAYRAQA